MKKRFFSSLSCIIAAVIAMSPVSYAHTGDIYSGSYTLNQQKNLKFRISMSVQNDLMNKDVYESALKWNNISSNVHVTIIMETPGMPTIGDTFGVYDGRGGNYEGADYFSNMGSTLAVTQYFDSNGNRIPVKDNKLNEKISYARILINVNNKNFKTTEDAAMNFTHEVGHTLLLAHPEKGASGHGSYDGLPVAVMNQGLPRTSAYVSSEPSGHDILCLMAKWGA